MGGPELIGSFTVYTQPDYEALDPNAAFALCRMNTAPLPSRVLSFPRVLSHDDASVFTETSSPPATASPSIAPAHDANMSVGLPFVRGRSTDSLPRFPMPSSVHAQSWPQDRPIAKALAASAFAIV